MNAPRKIIDTDVVEIPDSQESTNSEAQGACALPLPNYTSNRGHLCHGSACPPVSTKAKPVLLEIEKVSFPVKVNFI